MQDEEGQILSPGRVGEALVRALVGRFRSRSPTEHSAERCWPQLGHVVGVRDADGSKVVGMADRSRHRTNQCLAELGCVGALKQADLAPYRGIVRARSEPGRHVVAAEGSEW